ncbi:hypothetical protein U1Q18_040361 [Sarracenia purpurea var. burkii]
MYSAPWFSDGDLGIHASLSFWCFCSRAYSRLKVMVVSVSVVVIGEDKGKEAVLDKPSQDLGQPSSSFAILAEGFPEIEEGNVPDMRDIADPVPDSNEAIGISAEESTKCQELVLQGPTAVESVHAPLPQSSSAILVPLSPVGVRINEEDFPALEAAAIGISGSPGSKEPPDKNQRSSKKKKKR